ncbi:DUF2752 domain-containing protein [Mycobacterium sp.]|uniref:DUF2752 domain-containing protein n=1 Tax=Mycobacterium sp. TaxID=1785 RepID=UPI0025CC5FF2|nr:DUF2752 domain-containing protein [Mycobacterium sp.]
MISSRGRILGAGALLVGVLGYVGLVDPHNPHTVFPPCLFRRLTGWNCPACGGLRMVHDLLHGDLGAAVTDNAFLLAGIPLLALWMLARRRDAAPPIAAIVAVVLVTVVWTVLRNLPAFPLAPTVLPG